MDVARRPHMAASGANRARSHENRIGRRSEETHEEAIGGEPATHLPAPALAQGVERDDTVERTDEVRDDRGSVTPECDGQVRAVPCLLYTSPSPRDGLLSRMPSSA